MKKTNFSLNITTLYIVSFLFLNTVQARQQDNNDEDISLQRKVAKLIKEMPKEQLNAKYTFSPGNKKLHINFTINPVRGNKHQCNSLKSNKKLQQSHKPLLELNDTVDKIFGKYFHFQDKKDIALLSASELKGISSLSGQRTKINKDKKTALKKNRKGQFEFRLLVLLDQIIKENKFIFPKPQKKRTRINPWTRTLLHILAGNKIIIKDRGAAARLLLKFDNYIRKLKRSETINFQQYTRKREQNDLFINHDIIFGFNPNSDLEMSGNDKDQYSWIELRKRKLFRRTKSSKINKIQKQRHLILKRKQEEEIFRDLFKYCEQHEQTKALTSSKNIVIYIRDDGLLAKKWLNNSKNSTLRNMKPTEKKQNQFKLEIINNKDRNLKSFIFGTRSSKDKKRRKETYIILERNNNNDQDIFYFKYLPLISKRTKHKQNNNTLVMLQEFQEAVKKKNSGKHRKKSRRVPKKGRKKKIDNTKKNNNTPIIPLRNYGSTISTIKKDNLLINHNNKNVSKEKENGEDQGNLLAQIRKFKKSNLKKHKISKKDERQQSNTNVPLFELMQRSLKTRNMQMNNKTEEEEEEEEDEEEDEEETGW